MKKIILVPLLMASLTAHAVPNVWRTGFAQGFVEYSIEDAEGRTLWISCESGAGDDYDHSARIEINDKSYENSNSEYPLTFLINDREEVAPPASTNWRGGANQWYDFVHGMAEAKKIDVYLNNRKITTYKPINLSVSKDLIECTPKW